MSQGDHASGGERVWRAALAVGLVAVALRVWAPGPVTQTVDEVAWLRRSEAFHAAIAQGDLARATAAREGEVATMPGVTTMWAGTLGRELVRIGDWLGVAEPLQTSYDRSPPVLRAGRALVAAASALAVGAIVAVAARLVGRRAAVAAGVVLATEPFLVGHGDVLHTDSMVTLFGAAAVLTLAVAGARSIGWTRRAAVNAATGGAEPAADGAAPVVAVAVPAGWGQAGRGAALAGVWAGLGLLTKVNAVVVVVGGPLVLSALLAVDVARRDRTCLAAWSRCWAVIVATYATATMAVVGALWPALWVAPGDQVRLLRLSLTQADAGAATFFDGRTTADAPASFVLVTLAYRSTPWLLTAAVVVPVVLVIRTAWRWRRGGPVGAAWGPWWLGALGVVVPVVYLAAVAASAKKYDRYSLPVIPFVALGLGVVMAAAVGAVVRRRPSWSRAVRPAGLVLAVALAVHVAVQAPYAISYVSPVLGGQRRAEREILLGWGEGVERLGAVIAEREDGRCEGVEILHPQAVYVALPCGRRQWLEGFDGDLDRFDYAIVYITAHQRGGTDVEALEAAVRRQGRLIDEVRLGGVAYAQLYVITPSRR